MKTDKISLKEKLLELWQLYFTFFKIGAVTFGGGLAMLPILERTLIDKLKWTTKEDLMDYYAIGQVTPGIIAVNVATFIGFNKQGILGGIVATAGVISPSVIIITVIAFFLETFSDSLRIGLLIGLNSAENRCDANVATTISTITGRRKTAIITEHSNISKILGIFVSPISLYFQILPL